MRYFEKKNSKIFPEGPAKTLGASRECFGFCFPAGPRCGSWRAWHTCNKNIYTFKKNISLQASIIKTQLHWRSLRLLSPVSPRPKMSFTTQKTRTCIEFRICNLRMWRKNNSNSLPDLSTILLGLYKQWLASRLSLKIFDPKFAKCFPRSKVEVNILQTKK